MKELQLLLPAILVLFLFATLASTTPSGTCVPWTGVSPYCNIPVGTPIFIPDGYTSDLLFYTTLRGPNGVAFVGIPEPCYSTAIEILCSTTIRPCLQENNVTLLYPHQTCKPLCQRYLQECTEPFAAAGIPLYAFAFWTSLVNGSDPKNMTCEERDSYADYVKLYPEESTNYTINGTNHVAPCVDFAVTLSVACESPLVAVDSRYCALACPMPSLTDSQYDSAKIMQGIVSWFSWFLSAFLLVSFLVNPHMRRLPKGLILPTVIGTNILAGGMILPSMAGYDNIWCGGDDPTVSPHSYFYQVGSYGFLGTDSSTEDLTFYSSPCSFQGAILLFGFLVCTFWWAITAFNMFLEIYFKGWLDNAWSKWTRIVAYNIIGWGIPFAFMVIPTSAGAMGLAPGDTFCFITTQDNYAWILVFFFIPVGICLISGALFFFLSLIKLSIIAIRVRKWKEVCVPYVRVLLFVFSMFLVVSLFSAYVINNAANSSTISDGYNQYYACLSGVTFTPISECALPSDVVNYPLVMLKGFAISIFGVLLFFIFTSPQLFVHWFRIFQAIYHILRHHDKGSFLNLWNRMGTTTPTTTMTSSVTLAGVTTMTLAEDDGEEEEEDEGDEDDEDGDQEEGKKREKEEEGGSSSSSTEE